MKRIVLIGMALGLAASAFGQGLVKFANSGSTLISYGGWWPGAVIGTTPPGPSFYYALLTAPLGTTDPMAFTFAGIYATNTTTTTGGRFQGGSLLGVPVAGWVAGTSRSFEVAAWSADGGPTFNPAWMNNWYLPPSYFGLSPIGSGFAGGTDSNGAGIPAMAVFGAAPSITSGFAMILVPEPSGVTFAAFGVLLLLFRRRSHQRF